MKHKQPTKEELEEKIKEATDLKEEDLPTEEQIDEEAEKVEETVEEPVEQKPIKILKEAPEEEKPVKEPEQEPKVEEAEPSPEEKERLKKELEEKNKKLSASARENQKIYAKNRVLNKALIDADEIPDPTEEELQKEFTDWDIMSDIEKNLAKETIISKNWRAKIKSAQETAKKIEKWNDEVDSFVEDPTTLTDNPELEGKSDEFKEFALSEENNSVPMKILVSAFLHEKSKKTEHKGKMFETNSGGPNDRPEPKSDKLTLEEARKLRETDYNKWKEMLKAGKIESSF